MRRAFDTVHSLRRPGRRNKSPALVNSESAASPKRTDYSALFKTDRDARTSLFVHTCRLHSLPHILAFLSCSPLPARYNTLLTFTVTYIFALDCQRFHSSFAIFLCVRRVDKSPSWKLQKPSHFLSRALLISGLCMPIQ